jgi:hypothetical protein
MPTNIDSVTTKQHSKTVPWMAITNTQQPYMTHAPNSCFVVRVTIKHFATLFLRNADKHQFGHYQTTLKDSYLDGNNKYPTTIYDAYTQLLFCSMGNNQTLSFNANDGVAFATNGQPKYNNVEPEVVLATNGRSGNKP